MTKKVIPGKYAVSNCKGLAGYFFAGTILMRKGIAGNFYKSVHAGTVTVEG
jgi:hypothetical protein